MLRCEQHQGVSAVCSARRHSSENLHFDLAFDCRISMRSPITAIIVNAYLFLPLRLKRNTLLNPDGLLESVGINVEHQKASWFGSCRGQLAEPCSWFFSVGGTSIGPVPECSLGVIVQTLEANLAQVVFQPKSSDHRQCLIVPVERLCTPGHCGDDAGST